MSKDILNNIFKSLYYNDIYPDTSSKVKDILKSPIIKNDKEIMLNDVNILVSWNIITSEYYSHYYFKKGDDIIYLRNNIPHRNEKYGPARTRYLDGKRVEEYYKNGKIHRDNGPARIEYSLDKVYSEEYYKYNKLHRDNLPAVIRYFGNTNIIKLEKYFMNGKIHRDNGPAIITYSKTGIKLLEEYYTHGKKKYEVKSPFLTTTNTRFIKEAHFFACGFHRDESIGPAYIEYNKNGNVLSEVYYKQGEIYRHNGPSIMKYYDDGIIKSEEYYRTNKYFREDDTKPVMIEYYRNGNIKSLLYMNETKIKYHENGMMKC